MNRGESDVQFPAQMMVLMGAGMVVSVCLQVALQDPYVRTAAAATAPRSTHYIYFTAG